MLYERQNNAFFGEKLRYYTYSKMAKINKQLTINQLVRHRYYSTFRTKSKRF